MQSDNEPANWTRPVESWREGEIIADVHTFQLPADLAATSELVVNVGFFDLERPEIRLPLTVNGQAIADGVYTLGPLP